MLCRYLFKCVKKCCIQTTSILLTEMLNLIYTIIIYFFKSIDLIKKKMWSYIGYIYKNFIDGLLKLQKLLDCRYTSVTVAVKVENQLILRMWAFKHRWTIIMLKPQTTKKITKYNKVLVNWIIKKNYHHSSNITLIIRVRSTLLKCKDLKIIFFLWIKNCLCVYIFPQYNS